jgi:inner membrane protein
LGTYPVIGPWQESGFIISTPGGPRSTCKSTSCDWYADHADLSRGVHQTTTSFTLVAETAPTSTAAIRAALESLAADEIDLLGSFTAPESREALPTVAVSGDRVTPA